MHRVLHRIKSPKAEGAGSTRGATFVMRDRDVAAGWAALTPLAILLALTVLYLARWITQAELDNQSALFLAAYLEDCRPERLEQVRYLLVIALGPMLFLGAFVRLRRLTLASLRGFAATGQLTLLGLFVCAWRGEVFSYFGTKTLVFSVVAAFAVSGALLSYPRVSIDRFLPARSGRWAVLATLGLTIAFLSPSVFRDAEGYLRPGSGMYNLDFTAGEYLGVATGKTPLVDFYPQYNNVLPVLLSPVLRLSGYTITGFTVTMLSLSLAALVGIWWTFWVLTGSWWKALALYLPVLGLAFYSGDGQGSAFSYFAVWPMRYGWPWLNLAALAGTLRKPTDLRWLGLGALAGAGAINNVEFGVPALVACVAAVFLARVPRTLRSAVLYLGGVGFAAALIEVIWLGRSGSWADFSAVLGFSKIFAVYGFYMLPLPREGLYWTICATYLACLFVAIVRWWRADADSLYTGLLVFAAVFGCGSFMYYVGRSHPDVLVASFGAWAFAMMLLCYGFARGLQQAWKGAVWYLSVAPALLLAFHYALFAANLVPSARPFFAQFARLHLDAAETRHRRDELKEFVQRNLGAGEPTMLAFPMGHQMALEAGVHDVFPFAHPGSVILKAQVEKLRELLVAHRVEKVFSLGQWDQRPEIRTMFAALGLTRTASQREVNLWTRTADGERR